MALLVSAVGIQGARAETCLKLSRDIKISECQLSISCQTFQIPCPSCQYCVYLHFADFYVWYASVYDCLDVRVCMEL